MADDRSTVIAPASREVLHGRGEHLRAFISSQMSTSRGQVYAEERARLADAISAVPLFKPWTWERDAPVGQYYSEETCIAAASTSDCLILILGRHLTDTTRKEYEAAKANGANVFVFQDTRARPTPDVKAFIAAERDGVTTGKFSTADDLVEQVLRALRARAVYETRRGILARRPTDHPPADPVEDRGAPWNEPPRPKYEEIELTIGSDEGDEGLRPVTEVLSELREFAESGETEQALEQLHGLVFDVYAMGRPDAAQDLLAELRDIVPPGRADLAAEMSVLNTEALILSRLGHEKRAKPLWERMLEVGRRLDDQHLVATALQNLAICASNLEDWDTAEQLAREAITLKLDLDELHGAMQIFNEFILIATAKGDHEAATEFLDEYKRVGHATGDLDLLSSAYGNHGNYLVKLGDFVAAEEQYRASLDYARKSGDPVRELTSLQNVGAVCGDLDRNGDAMRWYRKGLRLAETYELPAHIEIFHRLLANALYQAGRAAEALREYDRARQAAFANDQIEMWAQSTINMGGIYIEIGQPEAAIDPLQRAITALRELGDYEWEARAQRNLVAAQRAMGDIRAAVATAETVLTLLERDDHEARAETLRGAAELCVRSLDLLDRSSQLFSEALDEEAEFLPAREVAERAAIAGAFLRDADAPELAIGFFTRAIDELARHGPSREHFDSLNDRAIAYGETDEPERAIADLERAADVATALGDMTLLQRSQLNLGEIRRRAGDPDRAAATLEGALGQARDLGDPETIAWTLDHLALALTDLESWTEAHAACDELARVATEHGLSRWLAEAENNRGQLAFLREDYEAAAAHYRAAAGAYAYDDPAGLPKVGAELESLSAAGQEDGIEVAAQRLIDQTQNGGDATEAVRHIGRSAISWLTRGETESAVGLYGAAVVLGAVSLDLPDEKTPASNVGSPERLPSFRAFVLAVGLVHTGIAESGVDELAFLRQLREFMDAEHHGLGSATQSLFKTAYDAMADKAGEAPSRPEDGDSPRGLAECARRPQP